MSQTFSRPLENVLLAALPQAEFSDLMPYLKPISLNLRLIIYEPNIPIEYVYFPTKGVVSLLTIMQNGEAVELATVGNEGMVGLPVFLGAKSIPGQAIVQVPGESYQMSADALRENVTMGSSLHELLQRYTQALFNQIAQSAACNRLHSVEERLCRWLLITTDRVGEDTFPLTQDFISQMLGVRRPTVSLAASILQKAGLIRYSRGVITILDKEGLEAAACECYEIVKMEFKRLVGDN